MRKVYLKRPDKSDGPEFVEGAIRSIEMHRPWVYPTTTLEGYRDYLSRITDPNQLGYLVCRCSDDKMVGVVNLGEIVRGCLQSAFVGYWGVDGVCGGGLMTEGVALVIDEAFSKHGLHRLEVNIQPGNLRSIRLAGRLGLRKEGFSPSYLKIGGEWKDHERWAMVSTEWRGVEQCLVGGRDGSGQSLVRS